MCVTRKIVPDSAKRVLLACVCLGSLFLSGVAHAASAEEFRTPEYMQNGRAYDWIKAAEAYALGFSGKGVTAGVLDDSAVWDHPEFAARSYYPILELQPPDFKSSHGVHTAGTVFALRDGYGMHGIAWGSDPLSVVMDFSDTPGALLSFLDFPQVSIINNSWGSNLYLSDFVLPQPWHAAAVDADALSLGRLAAERDILLVFAAGNEGHSSTGLPANLPSLVLGADLASGDVVFPYDFNGLLTDQQRRAISLNMISVSAFDPWAETSASHAFAAAFTNMADGATDYTLFAPGVDIYSSIYDKRKRYAYMQGTSMAAPIVSGVGALVKEAFPFMGGKQLADVLLSTATPITGENRQPFLILARAEEDQADAINVIAPDTLSGSDISVMLNDPARRAEFEKVAKLHYYEDVDDFISDVEDVLLTPSSSDPSDPDDVFFLLPEDTYKRLFGMGIVNAYKAVRGPGWLDAHRLNNGDMKNYGGTDYAMYSVDTKGYDGLWSNDIAEVKVGDTLYPGYDFGPSYPDPANNEFFGELHSLHVGLLKTGEGTLFLAGNNTYLGPTVVAAGTVALGVAGQADGTARLAGGVYVEEAGTFSGNGLVRGNLHFNGLVAPGLPLVTGNLTVEGDIEGGGELYAHLWSDGRVSRLVGKSGVYLNNTLVRLNDFAGDDDLPAPRYQLVVSESAMLTGTTVNNTATSRQGVTLLHEFRLVPEVQGLYAELSRTSTTPGAKALSEGFLAGLGLVNQGADLAAGQGMADAMDAARRAGSAGMGLGAFGLLSGGKLRYNTGSHVDMSSISLMTGLSFGLDLTPGYLTLGAFFEYGNGSYDTYNSFSNAASVDGDGDIYYVGGGILGRMDFTNTGPGHFYVEASGRGGKVHNEYDSSDLRDPSGRKADYDSSSAYFGFHLGTGYIWDISDAASLNIYGKYFWMRQKGDTVHLSTGDPVKFKDADSSRLRLGARFTYDINEYVSPYIGAAWEYEFNGKARATAFGYSIKAPKLEGNTGIGELGLSLKPTQKLPLSFDLGVQGYVGKREGVTGSLQVRFEF